MRSNTGRTPPVVLPLELWPLFAWRRRRYRRRHPLHARSTARSSRASATSGAATIADLGGARTAPGWWEWSPVKQAVEQLLARGEVVCTERRGFRRVYRLAESVVPSAAARDGPRRRRPVSPAWPRWPPRHMGVATEDDLADYFRMPVAAMRAAAQSRGADPGDGAGLGTARLGSTRPPSPAPAPRTRHRPVLLSPFDSLDLAPAAHRAPLRLPAPARGVHPVRQARARLLRHATARRRTGWSAASTPSAMAPCCASAASRWSRQRWWPWRRR